MSQQEPPPIGGVRYIEVSPPAGWQTMNKTVHEFDQDKVQDCKEDIDTLLVFTGLYSAVLSAFVIESYTDLQPDPNTQMTFLLERIANQTQSYSITSGTLNSTAQPPSPPPQFTAPLWAVRVNGLWFASLIISLATASFSMLVKQWLREYLASEYTSPQERLRARQYRKPGLGKWKVFEIAAVLPMLLQLSLGLFFLGLCFFTANVDDQMGLTCIPLVSGWAFLFVAATLAPLVSPRCPYKMPLLKSVMRTARTRMTMKMRRSLTSLLADLASTIGHSESAPVASIDDEEDQVVTGEQDDKEMLLSMDAIMADDNLLPTMWDVLKQRSDPANLLDFVVNLIASRAGSKAEYLRSSRPRRIPDLTLLSRRAWITFMEMLADLAGRRQLSPPPVSNPDWPYKTILLLLSTSHYPLPSSAKACLLSRLMAASGSLEGADAFARWIGPRSHEQEVAIDLRPLFDRLCLASDQGIQDDENALLPIAAILANDNILPTMLDLLKQQTHNPVQSLSCIAHLIVGRLGTDASHILLVRLRSIPDLTLLSQLAWDIVMEMLVDLADRRQPSGPLDDSSPDWLHKTTLLLLSTSPYPLLDFALACVRGLLPDAPVLAAAMPVAQWITSRPNEQEFNLHSLFRPIPGADERASQGDKDILLSIAAIMTDDNLLPTVRNMLKQSTYDPMQSLSFIIHLIVSRLGAGAEYLLPVRLRAIPDLTSISRRTWDTLMEMLVDLADRRDPSGSLLISSPDWLHKLTLLFLSTSPYPLPNSAVVCLRRLLAHNKEEWEGAVLSIARWISPRPDEKSFVFRPLSDRLQPVYEHGGQDDECLLTVLFMYSEFLRPYRSTSPSPGVQPPSLYTMLSQEPDLFEHQMARPILDDIWNLIHSVLLFDSKYDSPRTLNGRNECIHILWELSDRMVRRDNGIASLAAYWGNEQWDLLALTHTFSSLHHFTHAPRTYMLQLCMDAFAGTHDQAKIAENSATVACQFEDGTFDDTGRYIPIDMVRFCYLHIRLYAEHIQGGPPTVIASSLSDRSATLPEPVTWTSLWDATSAALHKYSAEEGWYAEYVQGHYYLPTSRTPDELLADDRRLAGECLDVMQSVERGGGTLSPDASAREPTFPDELIAALGFFILPEDVSKYPRLARLQERERPGLPQPASRTASPSGSADMLSLRDVTEPPPSSQPAIQLTQNGPSQEEPSSTQSNGRSHHIARDAEESRVDAGSTRGHAGAEEGPMNDEPGAARDGAAVRGKVGFDEAGDEATEDDESEGGVASEGDATERGPDEDNAQVDERQAAIADHLGPPGGGGEVGGEVGGYGSSGSGHEPPGRDGIEGRDGVGTKFVE